MLNIAIYDGIGNLDSFATRRLDNPYERLLSVAVAPRERAMYILSSNTNADTGRIQRVNY